MDAVALFNKVLKDNNLQVKLSRFTIRHLEDGAFMVDKPTIIVSFINPPVEQKQPTREEINLAQKVTDSAN